MYFGLVLGHVDAHCRRDNRFPFRELSESNFDRLKCLHVDRYTITEFGFVEEKEALLQGSYGPNLSRLREIKAKYDPSNLFSGVLNIEPK